MRRFLLVAAVVLSSAAGFAIRSLSLKASDAPAAGASAPAHDDERQRWEYAAVTRAQFAASPRGGQYWIVYFGGESGVQPATVEAGVSGNAQGKAIAMLGSNGWEMVGEGTLDTGRSSGRDEPPRALLFKRRRR